MKNLISKARTRLKRLVKDRRPDPAVQRFIDFSRRKWPAHTSADRDSVVLLGLFSSNPVIYCYAHVANYLAKRHGSRIESYQFVGQVSPTLRRVYESFGAKLTLGMNDAAAHEGRVQAKAAEIFSGLKTKWDVMRITVDDVLIGDQVYDSYLRFFNEPSVQLTDERLKNVLIQALGIFYVARDYLARTKVTAFITDDFSYINSGIITRLMHRAKVPIYLVLFGEPFWLLKLDPGPSGRGHNYPPPVGFPYYAYPRLFARLGEKERTAALDKARHVLEERLSGRFCPLVRMPSTTYAVSSERILHDHPEPRILVMMHDFVDSPHGYRDMLFPDFYEWVSFLLERASETPFRWYVKPHPCNADTDPSRKAISLANNRVMAELEKRFPKITFLSPTASNQQILNDGITAMFTVHGTAGHEYAYRGVPIVNCGDNPHIAYDFNIHVKTLEHYETCIREADRLQVHIDPRAIEEFVHMHYFYLPQRLGSRTNPIDERIFARPDWAARMTKPEIFDEFIAGATPEREQGLTEYFDHYFGQPDLMNTLETP